MAIHSKNDPPGVLGWILVGLTVVVLVIAIVVASNLVSRDTLDPMPVETLESF